MARKEGEDLPTFEARLRSVGLLEVTCRCGGKFIVGGARWYKPRRYMDLKGQEHTITGRPCPYCSRASRLPARASIR